VRVPYSPFRGAALIRPASFPPPVRPGDRVGVAALSGAVDPVRLEKGLAALRELGFEPVLARNVWASELVGDLRLAGGDARRVASLHELLEDETLGAIFFTRGGHGLMRIVDRLDWDLIGRRPRAFVGYSDLVPLLLGIVARLGWVAFHGPMVGADLARGLTVEERDSLLAALAGSPGPWPVSEADGDAEGVLMGGCLSLLSSLAGTAYLPDLRGSILFWEDLNEPHHRIDRMLHHLRLSGSLAGVGGMVTGHLDAPDGSRGPAAQALRSSFASLGLSIPLALGLPAGHIAPNLTLPLGARVRLDSARLELEWRPG
jgi:muramoyltetrapeptide carboxypeptidase